MNLFWMLPIIAFLHVFEEFAFPGGFGNWDRQYRSSLAASITPRFHVVINIVFLALCLLPLVLDAEYDVALWLSMGSVLLVNAVFHIRGTIKTRKYSPGLVTSVILYIPLATYGYWFFLSNQKTSLAQAFASSVTGIAYWLVSTLIHKRRAKKAETPAVESN